MKKRLLFVLASLMLMGTGAMAQSETLKGDVNGDGVVDVADIAAVIQIMTDNGDIEKTYYWYVGQTNPASLDTDPSADDTNFTNNKWHTLTTETLGKTITGGTSGNDWYVAVPTIKGLKPTASDHVTPNNTWQITKTITVNNVEYTVWLTNSQGVRQAVYMAKI